VTQSMSGPKVWLMAARPATLGAAVVPVAVGSAVAAKLGGFALGPALAALFGAVAIQIGTNFVNDVYDFEKGADTSARLGPTRAVQAGLLSARQVRIGAILSFLIATAFGAYLIAAAGWIVAIIGLASIAAGFAYTAGPFPLAYVGLGDLFVMLFFGFVAVCGTVFVQTGEVPALAWAAALPVGALSTGILAVNNLRDREQDLLADKRTLAVRFGKRFALAEYLLLLAASFLVPLALVVTEQASIAALLPWLTLPMAVKLASKAMREEGRALNHVLVGTGKLLVLFGSLFSLGLMIGA
jgi:1,4-dihydroxy-2-naphthoate polyprenyltransferase